MGIISGGSIIAGGSVLEDSGAGTPLSTVGIPLDSVKQVVTLDLGDSASGTGTLTVGDYGDVTMLFSILAAAVKSGIEALDATGVLTVTITGTGAVATPWVITVDVPAGPLTFTMADGTLAAAATLVNTTPGIVGSYQDRIALGGLVENVSTGDIYEMDGTKPLITYTRIDTI